MGETTSAKGPRALELAERHAPRMVALAKGFSIRCAKCRGKEPDLQEPCPVYGGAE